MSDKVTVSVIKLEDHFADVLSAATGEQIKKAVLPGGYVIEAYAKINIEKTFSKKQTGAMANSVITELAEETETSAAVNVGPTVIYGRIHELGGIVEPVTAKMLSWVDDGIRVFAKLVHIPARPYLRPAAEEHTDEILSAVGEQLKRQIEDAL